MISGITGPRQVSARSDGDIQEQQALDTYCVRARQRRSARAG
jgi:hypothetical protein